MKISLLLLQTKCEQYWPSALNAMISFSGISIVLREEVIHPEYTKRTLQVFV